MLVVEGLPLRARALGEDRLDAAVGVGADGVELALGELRPADALAPCAPELRLQRAEGDPAVGAAVGAVAEQPAGELDAPAARGRATGQVARGVHRQPRQCAVGHRDVDELALAGALALAQRGEDPERGHQRAAAEVGDLAAGLNGRAVGIAGEVEQPDPGQVVGVVPGSRRIRPVLAVAGDRAVDEPRVLLAQPLVADAEAVHHAGPERLEQHVGAAREPQQHVAAAGRLEVDPDGPLAAVQRQERRGRRAGIGALVLRLGPADVVAHPRVLDLDHVGAEVGQQQRAEAARQQAREVDHPQAAERAHTPSSSRVSATVATRRPASSAIARAFATRSPFERAIVPSGR